MTAAAPEADIEDDGERDRIARLLRFVAFFLAFPGLTIGLSFLLFADASDHVGHITLSLGFGSAGIFLGLASRRIAYRYDI